MSIMLSPTTPGDPMDVRSAKRASSMLGSQEFSTTRTALAVREEVEKLIQSAPIDEQPAFIAEMSAFNDLFARY